MPSFSRWLRGRALRRRATPMYGTPVGASHVRPTLWAVGMAALFGLATSGHTQTVISPAAAQVYRIGNVFAVARQPDGKFVIGGSFHSINGVPRNNIARINADGSLDTAWDPSADNVVDAIVIDAASNVFVGGYFDHIGGQPRQYLAKLQGSTGAADTNWDPHPNSGVSTLALDTNNLLVGGAFTTIGGVGRNYLAKVAISDGVLDTTWKPNPDGGVTLLVVDGTSVYVAGDFLNIGGQSRRYLAKLMAAGDGSADPAWNPQPDQFVSALAIDAAGNLFVGGYFTTIGGSSRHYLAKIPGIGAGTVDGSWAPALNSVVDVLTVQGTDLYVGGYFTAVGNTARNLIAKLSTNDPSVVDSMWNPDADGGVYAIAVAPSGDVVAGGSFATIGGQTRLGIALLTGSVGAAAPLSGLALASPGAHDTGWINAVARDASGRTMVGGFFDFAGDGTRRNNIARFNADGGLDALWNPNAFGEISALAIDGNGDIVAGGNFSEIGNQYHRGIAKLSPSGAGEADASWNPAGADGYVSAIVVDGSDVYAAGAFSSIGGVARNRIAKLADSGAGTVDPTWNPDANEFVQTLVRDGGSLYAIGLFTAIGGQARNHIAKLSTTAAGAADAAWDPSPDGWVQAIAADGQGNVYFGGFFSTIEGQFHSAAIAKLAGSGSGAPDALWNPSVSAPIVILVDGQDVYAGGYGGELGSAIKGLQKLSSGDGAADDGWDPRPDIGVYALSIDGNGNLYVGGRFTNIAGQARWGYAVLGPYKVDVVSNTNPSVFPDAITISATLTGSRGVMTGTVTFKDEGTAIAGCVALPLTTSGRATCALPLLSVGVHTIEVEYSGDAVYSGSRGTILSQVVNKASSAVALVSFQNPALGSNVTLTATIAGAGSAGSVEFVNDGSTMIGCGNVATITGINSSVATCTTSAFAIGTHSVVAKYSGNANYTASISPPLSQVVSEANVALASNGGVASASTTYPSGSYPAAAINNDERAGRSWGSGGGWNDDSANAFPDWVQINFNGSKTIDRVVVYTVQDDYANPVEPSDAMTFAKWGLTAFAVQGWSGSAWVPLGFAVTGNNLVKRGVMFPPYTTSRIRVSITGALASYSRVTEVEAWGIDAINAPSTTTLTSSLNPSTFGAAVLFTATVLGTAPTGNVNFTDNGTSIGGCATVPLSGIGNTKTAQCSTSQLTPVTHSITASYGGDLVNAASTNGMLSQVVTGSLSINFALASNGGVATASSMISPAFPASSINNNERAGVNWGNGGGWNDASANTYPDWVQIAFSGSKTIDRVVVYTVQDNYANPSEPTDTQTFSLYGVTAFTVQGQQGKKWLTLAKVVGNNLVKRSVTFPPFSTNRIRISVTNALGSYSRITEVEAWGN